AKVKNQAITTAKIADDAVTGAKLNESTLAQVPNAASASSAADAEAVNGMHVGRIDYVVEAGSPETTVFSAHGLFLHASCSPSKQLEFTATTSVEHSEIAASGNLNSEFGGYIQTDFKPAEVAFIGLGIGNGQQSANQGQLIYTTPEGDVVTAQFFLE